MADSQPISPHPQLATCHRVICVTLNTHVATILPPPLAEGGKDQRIRPHSHKTTRLHISTTGEMTKILKDILKQQQQVWPRMLYPAHTRGRHSPAVCGMQRGGSVSWGGCGDPVCALIHYWLVGDSVQALQKDIWWLLPKLKTHFLLGAAIPLWEICPTVKTMLGFSYLLQHF